MNRREFVWVGLKLSSLAAIAPGFITDAAPQGGNSWGFSLLPWDNSPLEGVEFAKKMKPDFFFISASFLKQKDFKSQDWKSATKKAGASGTGFFYGSLPFNFEDQTSEIERFTLVCEEAKAAGGKFVLVQGTARESYGPGPEKIRKLGSSLNAAGIIARSKGLRLFFQHGHETQIRTQEELGLLMAATEKKNIQLALDFAHFSLSGGNLDSFTSAHGRRIGLVVLKDLQSPFNRNDGKRSYNYRFTEPGIGKLDFSQLFTLLKDKGIRPIFLPDPQLPDARTPDKLSLDYLEKLRPFLGIAS